MKRVVVGLSGGVDSSVAAYLLKEQGYEVIGLFMKNWHDDSVTISNDCPWLEDSNDALLVAEKLGIPFQTVDLSEEYKERIVDYMFNEYEKGRTPNPDVLCNREIKFDVFMKIALSLGADYVATGHYCRKGTLEQDGEEIYQLLAGADGNKDQSYFLCQLSQEQLSKSLFPIGELTKPEVREIAAKMELATAEKKDSQGLCFIGKVRLPEFLQQQLQPKEGLIFEVAADGDYYSAQMPVFDDLKERLAYQAKNIDYKPQMGKVVGKHPGAHYFTIGQRKGLNVGGTKEPLFIIATDV
ncbi:MAG: tRNA 2-thiouridine(34) synthase MnmA, partial [Flavobacterium sp.]